LPTERAGHRAHRRSAGIRAVAIHGRTRCQQYTGEAEYDTIAGQDTESAFPVIANGDISSPEKARRVLDTPAPTAS
jgi:tRNA-dihydrouridine synthase B